LDHRTLPCVFLGFRSHNKSYIVYNLHTQTIEVSRNVIFYENCFPFSTINVNDPTTLAYPFITTHNPRAFSSLTDSPPLIPSSPQTKPISSKHSLRKSNRIRTRPLKYNDNQTTFASATMINPLGTKYPISSMISYNKVSSHYHNFILNVLKLYSFHCISFVSLSIFECGIP